MLLVLGDSVQPPDVQLFGLVNQQIVKVQRRAAQAQIKRHPHGMGQQCPRHPSGQMPGVASAHTGQPDLLLKLADDRFNALTQPPQ